MSTRDGDHGQGTGPTNVFGHDKSPCSISNMPCRGIALFRASLISCRDAGGVSRWTVALHNMSMSR